MQIRRYHATAKALTITLVLQTARDQQKSKYTKKTIHVPKAMRSFNGSLTTLQLGVLRLAWFKSRASGMSMRCPSAVRPL
ncbi:hypothetical protein B9J09_07690 [Xylella fastidiosa subsp. pauca]|uniref:hypothetical protein n=1 Tax=Xylella fastidiosa TaxID=2371 RepID=UPI000582F345|nr:hypothetical protein [Xylella fastidiosa]ARO68927.1 hypothetical protein B9J09_07690 [Xylella fastidiosa subsp. pauca]AVI20986.1 hypothetical protein BCV75_07175 [Xylella fastidiosa]AVI23013.1 hypothetical protein BC375_07235 [Xylella fastidiosa]KIA58167.1 hypothetical protein RA12_06495 [Xylella fastidiosa]KXB10133.1 hypothetical protein ADT32_10520 [Xylella fastidiosa]